MRRPLKRILVVLGILLLVAAVGLGAGYAWLRTSLPDYEARHRIAGLGAPVEIVRDAHAVVTIRAADERDAATGLGFAHAQDRLWQMDFMRRAGSGRLSEVAGEATLGIDRYMRTLGLYRLAERNLAHLSPEARDLIEAYTAGVNAFLDQREGTLPPEFALLRYEPEPWRAADSLVWGRIMALLLSTNWRTEALRAGLAKRLDAEQLAVLWPEYPDTAPTTLARAAHAHDKTPLRALGDLLPAELRSLSASNAWAVDGRSSPTGSPILANDPHLALRSPGYWYLVRIETPELTLAGVTSPGVPLMVIGHNGHIAWGFTSTESDTQDLYVERESRDQPGYYEAPDGLRAFETREEVIAVRGADDVTLTVRATRHGPVVSDAVPASKIATDDGEVLALAWTALKEDDRTAEAVYRMNRARSWDEFLAAMRDFHSPQQTILYADTTGDIGLIAPGRVPVRKTGDGSVPVPGWTEDHDWTGTIPFEALPQARNPPDGRFIAANHRLVNHDYRYRLTSQWQEPQRAERIAQLLDAGPGADPVQHTAMQMDSVSLAAEELVPLMLELAPGDGRTLPLVEHLHAWNFEMDRDRPEPLIFQAWLAAANKRLLADELGVDFASFASPKVQVIGSVLRNNQEWCDDVNTADAIETCAEQLDWALEDALDYLRERFGDEPSGWRWGDAHVASLPHMIFSRNWLGRLLLDSPVETDGGDYTVNRGAARFDGPASSRFEHVHGPGLRVVFDLADLDRSLFVVTGGQSGNPLSARYADFSARWRDGEYVTLASPEAGTGQTLHLEPR